MQRTGASKRRLDAEKLSFSGVGADEKNTREAQQPSAKLANSHQPAGSRAVAGRFRSPHAPLRRCGRAVARSTVTVGGLRLCPRFATVRAHFASRRWFESAKLRGNPGRRTHRAGRSGLHCPDCSHRLAVPAMTPCWTRRGRRPCTSHSVHRPRRVRAVEVTAARGLPAGHLLAQCTRAARQGEALHGQRRQARWCPR